MFQRWESEVFEESKAFTMFQRPSGDGGAEQEGELANFFVKKPLLLLFFLSLCLVHRVHGYNIG